MHIHDGKCNKCGSKDIKENPTIIDCDDGSWEYNYDTVEASCQSCGFEFLIV